MDDEQEGYVELIEDHYNLNEPWPMVLLAHDSKGTKTEVDTLNQHISGSGKNSPMKYYEFSMELTW
jgi:hypothetical protein